LTHRGCMNLLQRMSEQLIVVSHLYPIRVGTPILLRFTPVPEVRPKTPILDGSNSIEENSCDSLRQIGDRVLVDIRIGQHDSKENRRFICRVRPDPVGNVRHLRAQGTERVLDESINIALVNVSCGNHRHVLIISLSYVGLPKPAPKPIPSPAVKIY